MAVRAAVRLVAARAALALHGGVLEDERSRDVVVALGAATIVGFPHAREVRRAVRVVAVEARRRRGAGAVSLGKPERGAHVLVAAVAEVGRAPAQHRLADAAVAVVAVRARDARERVLAPEEAVTADVLRVAAQAR